jgi:hypothetical protein
LGWGGVGGWVGGWIPCDAYERADKQQLQKQACSNPRRSARRKPTHLLRQLAALVVANWGGGVWSGVASPVSGSRPDGVAKRLENEL